MSCSVLDLFFHLSQEVGVSFEKQDAIENPYISSKPLQYCIIVISFQRLLIYEFKMCSCIPVALLADIYLHRHLLLMKNV